jgi:hypothetical protein
MHTMLPIPHMSIATAIAHNGFLAGRFLQLIQHLSRRIRCLGAKGQATCQQVILEVRRGIVANICAVRVLCKTPLAVHPRVVLFELVSEHRILEDFSRIVYLVLWKPVCMVPCTWAAVASIRGILLRRASPPHFCCRRRLLTQHRQKIPSSALLTLGRRSF